MRFVVPVQADIRLARLLYCAEALRTTLFLRELEANTPDGLDVLMGVRLLEF